MSNKVSVIIPIYNCESFLDNCLDSILNQEYKNIEVILVNDGSSDNSLDICEKRKLSDSRIIVIDKKNGGVSSARNLGLKHSTGEYVFFVDGDDYIELDCIQKCMDIVLKYDLDILKFGYIKELSKRVTKKYNYSVLLNQKIESKEYNEKLYPYVFYTNDFCNVTNAIIKKNIIKEVKFHLNRLIGEDYLFFVQCLNNSKNIYFMDKFFYHYVVNAESATHKFNKEKNVKKLSDSIFVNTEIRKILLNKNYDNYDSYISKCNYNIYSNIQVCIVNNNYDIFCNYIDEIFSDEFLKNKLNEIYSNLSNNVHLLLNKNKTFFYICKFKNMTKSILKGIASKIM